MAGVGAEVDGVVVDGVAVDGVVVDGDAGRIHSTQRVTSTVNARLNVQLRGEVT